MLPKANSSVSMRLELDVESVSVKDCHVAPRRGWHEETIRLLQEKSRRLVIPMIGALNIDTWDEIPGGGFVGKCWVNFNAAARIQSRKHCDGLGLVVV